MPKWRPWQPCLCCLLRWLLSCSPAQTSPIRRENRDFNKPVRVALPLVSSQAAKTMDHHILHTVSEATGILTIDEAEIKGVFFQNLGNLISVSFKVTLISLSESIRCSAKSDSLICFIGLYIYIYILQTLN